MNDENLISAQEMIMTAFTNIERTEFEKNNKLLKSWKFTVQSIKSNSPNGKNLGENLYFHSHIVDLKNGILLIECDHPGWIQTLRLYQKYILTGLRKSVPELKISSLAFRIRGTKARLHKEDFHEEIKKEMELKIQKEEEIIRNFDEKKSESMSSERKNDMSSEEKKELPENLQRILDRLKYDMLTNGE